MDSVLVNAENLPSDKLVDIGEALIRSGIDFRFEGYIFYVFEQYIDAAKAEIEG